MTTASARHRVLHEIDLDGSPREMGRQHGEALRAVVQETILRAREDLDMTAGAAPAYLARFVQSSFSRRACERWAPGLLDEIAGIAEGADVDPDEALAFNLGDELLWWRREQGDQRHVGGGHCSAVGLRMGSEGVPLTGYNLDLEPWMSGTLTLQRIRPTGAPQALVLGPAGCVGYAGVNASGVSVACNAVEALRGSPEGVPVTFVARTVLRSATTQEAVGFVETVPHASGHNYTLGGPLEVVMLETSARKVIGHHTGWARLWHTNHELVNDDVTGHEPAYLANTQARYAQLERSMAEVVDVAGIMAALSDRTAPVCAVPDPDGSGSLTLGALVVEHHVPPVAHIAVGPPNGARWRRVEL